MIREKDGIHIQSHREVVADSRSSTGEVNLMSHAHADHTLNKESAEVICSELTASIAMERFDTELNYSEADEGIELLPSGHILGSRAALIDEKILYTGDISTQDRIYMNGFEPVKADKLVIESTYGVPAYSLPDQKEVVKKIEDWIQDNSQTLFLFGYSLGKAQKIQQIVHRSTDRPVIAHGAVRKMNEVIEENTDLEFRAKPYRQNRDLLEENGIMIAPSRSSKADYVQKLVEKHEGVKAGFSGWAVQESFKHRGGYDRVFPLSDHCGFRDLVELVKKVDPEKVYTHHGFDEAFASYLSRELGFNARALKNNQSSLDEFN